MKFLRILLLPLLSTLLVTENQSLGKCCNSYLGASSIEQCSEKTDARVANLKKQGGAEAKVARNITGAENQSVNFILSGLGKSEARSFAQSMGLSKAQLSSVNSAIKRMTSTSVSKVTQNGSDVVVQIFRKGRNGYQVIETTVRVNGSKQVIQKAYDLSGKLVHFHPKKL